MNKTLCVMLATMGAINFILGVLYIIFYFILDGYDFIAMMQEAAIMIGFGGFFFYIGIRYMKEK